jgi:thiosulfate dehydrogenase [quinone] large subunit
MFRMTRITAPNGTVTFHDPPIAQLLFSSTKLAWLWLLIRLYVGWAWLEAGLHKLFVVDAATGAILWGQLNPAWMLSGSGIRGYWEKAVAIPAAPAKPAITYDWFRDFLSFLLAIQAEGWMSKLIVFGELAIGVGLIVGAFVGVAAVFGAFMNMNFMLAGTASSNPVLFGLAVLLILGWKAAGYWGLDRVLLPALGTPWERTPQAAPGARPPAPAAPLTR